MKSAGKEGELEQELDGLLKTAASVEMIDNLADRFEAAGASADLVGELRKVASDLAEDEGEKKEETESKVIKPERRSMTKWLVNRLTSNMKEEPVTEEKKGDEKPEGEKPTGEAVSLTKDDLMKAVNESLAASKEDWLKLVGERVGAEIQKATDPLKAEIEGIKEAKGLRKSVDGQETQKETEVKKPLKKEFGKGMFDDVFGDMRVRHLNDRIAEYQHSTSKEEE